MLKYSLSALFIAFTLNGFTQTNLVPNHRFDNIDKKVKDAGEIEKAIPWTAATAGDPDLFTTNTKVDEVKAPLNSLGEQRAYRGENYAGLVAYKYKDANVREYLQVQLTQPLDSAKTYCVEFYISLADLSKYAVDGMGAYLSKDRIKTDNWNVLNVEAQIQNPSKRVLQDAIEWEIICSEFTANGGEEYLTIGNFKKDDDLIVQKVKKPKSIRGIQNTYGYYYIDEVSIIEKSEFGAKGCECEKKINMGKVVNDMNYVYSKVEQEEQLEKSPAEFIEKTVIKFAEFSSELAGKEKIEAERVAKLLKSNKTLKFEIIASGHSEEIEKDAEILNKRAKVVYDIIVNYGVAKSQIQIGEPNEVKVSDKTLPETKSGATKVEFEELID